MDDQERQPFSCMMRKLEHFARLSKTDKQAIEGILSAPQKMIKANRDLVREGDAVEYAILLLDGFAYRYKELEDGRRQIVGFFLPGDLCDFNIFVLEEMDHSIATITAARYALLSRCAVRTLILDRRRLMHALNWEILVNAAIQREWILSLGKRSALERMSHLFCELYHRLEAIGLADRMVCPFPLTQLQLAEVSGLSSMHVSRTLRQLRAHGIIDLTRGRLSIKDYDALCEIGMFNPHYLHLDQVGAALDAVD